MATDPDLARAVRAVQQVVGHPAFAEVAADPEQFKACREAPEGTLRARGVPVPPEIRRVVMKVRHTPPLARQRGLRGGNFEWRFSVQVGERSWRLIYLCDAWPLDAEDAADEA
jgi:hypothetical protein